MELTQFLKTQVDSLCVLSPRCRKIVGHYLDGLIRGHKKSIAWIIRELQFPFTTQFWLKQLKQLPARSSRLKKHLYQQILSKVDRRSKFFLVGDDTTHRVYGKEIYGAAVQYDHALKAFLNAIKLVDLVTSNSKDCMLLNDFTIYLPRNFVAAHSWLGYRYRSKIALVSELTCSMVHVLRKAAVPKNNIWVLVDSWYSSGKFEKRIRAAGANYVLQVKKDRRIRLFRQWKRIDHYFEYYKSPRYFTAPPENKKIFYKEAILDGSKFGRRKVFGFKEESEKEWRYFVSSKLSLTAKTAYQYVRKRWTVETMHRETKQYFGLGATYSGRAEYLLAHYFCSYYAWLLFQWYKWQIIGEQNYMTTEELWLQYIQESSEKKQITSHHFLETAKIYQLPLQKNVKLKNRKIPVEVI